mgnify:CR=1 FL=1
MNFLNIKNPGEFLNLLASDSLDLIDDDTEALALIRERTIENDLRLAEIYLCTPAEKRAEFLAQENIGKDYLRRVITCALTFKSLVLNGGMSQQEAILFLGRTVFLNSK